MSHKEFIWAWIVGSVLLLLSGWLCAINATVFWKIFVRRVNAPSWIPLLGGVLGVFGLGVIPIELAHKLCWLPLILDWGSVPGILHTIIAFLQNAKAVTDHPTAREVVRSHLQKMETGMNSERKAMSGGVNRPPCQLVIVGEQEHDFGWVFFWNTKEFAGTGDHRFALAGNGPLVVDRHDGHLYGFGTAIPLERSIEQYRKGIRHRVKDV